MRLLFVSGAGILPEQRVARWQMVSQLYASLGRAMQALGHQVYFYVHPEAMHEDLPKAATWCQPDHGHFGYVLESFAPDFVFCWNGWSPGDRITTAMAASANAKMIFSEQGWFPQKSKLYFDMTGTNARCGTRFSQFSKLDTAAREKFLIARAGYIQESQIGHLFDDATFRIQPPDMSLPVFVPLQDERDLNIVQDSPFRTMDEFVGYLAQKLPGMTLRVRPHPKYPDPKLTPRPGVVVDNPQKPMFQSLSECGLVMGINSTTLLESALLGKTVISFGESLATGTGLLCDLRPGEDINLSSLAIDIQTAEAVLAVLLEKQMPRTDLSNPVKVMQSALFRDMRRFVRKPSLHGWM
ncbi:hypothetical protein [Paracoccus litorisediminis]|uniref:Capsular polysaccharide export protein n=1 Tax=Paracoccus litorisediminis TaxID=2006130 RepID=A0A844HSH9_9RHOB|nr:hypothetical protein [Paracoccus litorisediminis]MTH62038.1 hypothetical protein [Paracoccus litorisediminis]